MKHKEREEKRTDEFLQPENTCLNSFLQTNAIVQSAGVLAFVSRTVAAVYIVGVIAESGYLDAVASRFGIGRGHHLLFIAVQMGIPHEVA